MFPQWIKLYTEDTEIPKAMEEVKSDRHPQTRKRLYITKELQTNLTVVSHIQVVRTYDPKPTEPTDINHDYRLASWIQTRKVYNRTTTQLDTNTLKMAMSEAWSQEPCLLIYQPPTTQATTEQDIQNDIRYQVHRSHREHTLQ